MSHEPVLISDPGLHGILEELKDREPIFHRPELGFTRAHFEQMTLPDFWETGASGKRYNREFVLAELDRRYASGPYKDRWEASEFYCRQLAPDVYLLTYTLIQEGSRKTRRLTIWQRSPDGWKVAYHQGTLVLEP